MSNHNANESQRIKTYDHLEANHNLALYDALTLHIEHLEFLETLICQAKDQLGKIESQNSHVSNAKSNLDIAQYLIGDFYEMTQRDIKRISQPSINTKQ